MVDYDSLDDREAYEQMPIEELGMEGCCKIFCDEYIRIEPSAALWGVKRKDGSLAHAFIVNGEFAYDIRGGRHSADMVQEPGEAVCPISLNEFRQWTTWADGEELLREVATIRFRQTLEKNRAKYGLSD